MAITLSPKVAAEFASFAYEAQNQKTLGLILPAALAGDFTLPKD